MFAFRNASFVGFIVQMPYCASHLVTHFSSGHGRLAVKRPSPYSSVDTDRYSSLVKSVMSVTTRVSAQTPMTIEEEDELVYGPVIKTSQPSSTSTTTTITTGASTTNTTSTITTRASTISTTTTRGQKRLPKVLHPFLHPEETTAPAAAAAEEEDGTGTQPVTRIRLSRGKDRSSVPSVTRILQQTMSPEQIFYLERWKRRMVQELGEEGFKEYSQNLFRQGKMFHSTLEDVLMSGVKWAERDTSESQCPPEVRGYMDSVSHILEDVREVKAIESTVQHNSLNYLGIVDCVARYRGVLCAIDWKTSEKQKPFLSNTFDNPVQVAAYAGALNTDSNYKYQIENGLIVVAYKDGSPAHAHQLNTDLMSDYWKTWLLRLEDYQEKGSTQA